MSTVVIDTCAGQEDGREALAAAAIASLDLDLQIVVVGDEGMITAALQGIAHDAERLRVVHACDVLPEDVNVRAAPPRSSVAVGLELTARDPDAIFISAGPPGSIVSLALHTLGRLPAVPRAALAAVYPTLRHRGPNDDPFALLLDVGATIECNSEHLVCFAAMGAAYASKISGVERPRVGLLANGSVSSATPLRVREAHARLRDRALPFEYLGLMRGDQVTHGDADVIVTDGFSGDVLVRTLEGVAATADALIRRAEERFQWRLGVQMLGGGIAKLREFTDWENYGGAPLLGVDRPVIVTQGNSGRRAFVNAIRLGAKMQRLGVIEAVAAGAAAVAEEPDL
ncbi:MAG: hypothetical protein R3A79_09130 [Nannocystaceae bacterium]